MSENLSDEILGNGASYPFNVKGNVGTVRQSSGEENVKKSIAHILDVSIGEWHGRLEFGSRLPETVFMLNDPANDSIINHYIYEALEKWEPRILIQQIDIDRSRREEGLVLIYIEYSIIATRAIDNFVYPYYTEGAE